MKSKKVDIFSFFIRKIEIHSYLIVGLEITIECLSYYPNANRLSQ